MIVDLNVKGKIVAVVGGGREAVRKIQALLTQDCEIVVIAAEASRELERWAKEGKIVLKRRRIESGE
ncbi:MAG: NAD(P)-dependent oxidoreductase, partial [Nitrospinales bacterium]